MSDLIPVGRIGKRFWLKKRKKIQLEGGKYGSTSKKGCKKKQGKQGPELIFRQVTVVLAVIRLPRTWLVMVRRAPGTKGMMLFIILMDFMMRIIIRMMIIVKILTPLLVMVRRCEESHEQKV